MRHGLKALALVVLLAGPMAANAVPFEFSYRFGNGDVVTGTLNGDQSGQYVDNVTDISVFLNGVQFTGPLYFSSWDDSGIPNYTTSDGTISFDASLNNFMFVDVDYPTDSQYTNYFFMAEAYGINQASAYGGGTFRSDFPLVASNWSLRAVGVPEPGTLGLLGLGLAGLGFARRRKTA